MSYSKVNYSLANNVARIALNEPETLNAMSQAMGEELLEAIDRGGNEARAIVITGEGRGFCSGANLAEGGFDLTDPTRDVGIRLPTIFNPVVMAMKTTEIPVITAIKGPAVGVGCGIALAGDIIFCAEKGYFLQAFSNLGLAPDGGSSYLLSKAMGRVRAMEMMLLGERIYGPKALEWGLVTRVVPDDELHDAAMEMAEKMAKGPKSLGIVKRVAWAALDASLETALGNERLGQREAGRTEDLIEGVMAFREKREAKFTGR